MKRFAAHRIFLPPDMVFPLHVIELDDHHCIQRLFPLENEISQTFFFNGILLLLNQKMILEPFLQTIKNEMLADRSDLSILQFLMQSALPALEKDDPVFLYVLERIPLLTKQSESFVHPTTIQVRQIY
ncbi:MAG: hypothetical protein FWF52_08055 [Candidatus Azobacteroides sp.]|nr:hypothetical protein [Candidatus Azobacteroides sp.]